MLPKFEPVSATHIQHSNHEYEGLYDLNLKGRCTGQRVASADCLAGSASRACVIVWWFLQFVPPILFHCFHLASLLGSVGSAVSFHMNVIGSHVKP